MANFGLILMLIGGILVAVGGFVYNKYSGKSRNENHEQIVNKQNELGNKIDSTKNEISNKIDSVEKKKGKAVKGSSQRESLDLFKSGRSIEEIAGERGLAISTVQGHLADFVLSGELEPQQLITQQTIDTILDVLNQSSKDDNSASIKERLGDAYTYTDIRIVQNYRRRSIQTK